MIKSIRGAHYYVEVKGSGQPILFLHGFTGDTTTWHETIDLLAKRGQCIAVDLPGHGETEMTDDPARFDVNETCKDLDEILDEFNVDKSHVVGYSMGGRVALSFSLKYPERVSRLVLESASPGIKQENEREQRRKNDEDLAQFIECEGIEAFVDKWENTPLFASQKRTSSAIQEKIRNQRLQNDPVGLATSLRRIGTGIQPSWWDFLIDLHCETLLIVGEEDLKFRNIADEMKKRIPFAKKVVIPSAGHAIHVEQPQKFGTMLMEFLFEG